MRKQETVFVRNNGTEPFSDRYNGEDFTIEPGEFEEMLVETAELCLGFGEDDKTRVIRRGGVRPVVFATAVTHRRGKP